MRPLWAVSETSQHVQVGHEQRRQQHVASQAYKLEQIYLRTSMILNNHVAIFSAELAE